MAITTGQLAEAHAAADTAYLAGKPGTPAAYGRAYRAAYAALCPLSREDAWTPDRIAAYTEAHHQLRAAQQAAGQPQG